MAKKGEVQQRGEEPRPYAEELYGALQKAGKALQRLLGTEDMAKRAITVAFVLVRRTPELQRCTIESIVTGMLQSAELGLELGTQAYLVPRNVKVQRNGKDEWEWQASFQADWKGLVDLAIKVGSITSAHGDLVYPNDTFYSRRTEHGVEFMHERERFGKRAEQDTYEAHLAAGCQGAYFIAHTSEGPPIVQIMSIEEIHYVWQTYSQKSRDGGPNPMWGKRWSRAAIKTVAHQALKLVRKTEKLTKAIELDHRAESGIVSGVVEEDVPRFAPYQEPQPLPTTSPAPDEDEERMRQEELAMQQEGK